MTTKIPRISAKFYTTLSKKVNVADTTATLNLATDLDGDVLPSGRYGFTIDEGNSSVEYIEADLVSTALTNVKRLDPTTLAETTGFVKEHRAGAEVKITDFTVLGRIRNVLLGIEDLDDGAPIKYGASPSLSDPLMLATVEYVLSVVNGGAVTFDTQVIAGIAGESISSGQWVYFKESDGRWYLTDANTQSTVKNVRIGMAKGAGTTGNAISGGVFVAGIEKTGTYVAGTTYYLSNTAGALSTTAGEFEALVGIADANGELLFLNIYDPEGTTPEEKDALAGTVGTPNASNKYVTENNLTTGGTDQSQTTQNSSVEVGSANATTQKNKIAQSFIPTKNKIRGVTLYKYADTGTFTGTVKVALQADSGGNPDGVDLASVTMSNAEWRTALVGELEFIFSSEYSSLLNVPNTTYWIVVTTSTSDNSNRINLGFNTAGGYANGTLKYNNTADGWVEITGDDLYFKTLEGIKNQVVKTNSDGEISGLTKTPVIRKYDTVSTAIGSSTTQFDITNPSGTTFRYTWDSTGTDPGISLANNPVGSLINFQAQNFNSANNGLFVVTGAGSNYVEVTNASGVVESNKTIGTGYIVKSGTSTWTKPTGLKYVIVELVGGGGDGGNGRDDGTSGGSGGGGGAGGYSKKLIQASSLSSSEYYIVGDANRLSAFGSHLYATGGSDGGNFQTDDGFGGPGGSGFNGDINIGGGDGSPGTETSTTNVMSGGNGGQSQLGGSGSGAETDASAGDNGNLYGGGAGGGAGGGNGASNGGTGAQGIVILTEYY